MLDAGHGTVIDTPAALRPSRIFWFRRWANFGDGLTVPLARHFAGLEARWSRPQTSEAVLIGSIAGRLPVRYRGAVIGIGKIRPDLQIDLSSATVLGLRGLLTLRGARVRGDIVLGDPGLLALDLLGGRPPVTRPLGVVPHYVDDGLAARYPDALRIDVAQDPLEVLREIASCERIVSSSLHGLIAADSFGIPRRWDPCPALKGGSFKFDDYASALGIRMEPGRWETVPASAVSSARAALRDALKELPSVLPPQPEPTGLGRLRRLVPPSWRQRGR